MPTRYNPNHNIVWPETTPKIRQALRQGNTAEAVNLVLQSNEKETLPLFEKFSEAQQQYGDKRIGIEEWGRTQAQICQSILGKSWMIETETRESPTTEIKAKILPLLHKHKTEQALVLCERFGDQYLLFQAQLYVAKSQSGTGLIESEYYEATKSKINDALFELMGQINEPHHSKGLLDWIMRLFK